MHKPSAETLARAAELERLFCENLNYYMELKGRSQADLARAMDVSTSAASYWLTCQRVPRMNMIAKIAIWLGIEPHDLLSEREGYYLDDDTKGIARAISADRELALLLDAARRSTPEGIRLAHEMLTALKRKEVGDDEDIDQTRKGDDFEG